MEDEINKYLNDARYNPEQLKFYDKYIQILERKVNDRLSMKSVDIRFLYMISMIKKHQYVKKDIANEENKNKKQTLRKIIKMTTKELNKINIDAQPQFIPGINDYLRKYEGDCK